jgi:hypothetical protein
MTTRAIATDRPINCVAIDIAEEIIRLGIAPTDYLAAYLPPLFCITDLSQEYGFDSAAGIAAYCVDALENQAGWRGPRAKRLLTELDGRVRRFYRETFA